MRNEGLRAPVLPFGPAAMAGWPAIILLPATTVPAPSSYDHGYDSFPGHSTRTSFPDTSKQGPLTYASVREGLIEHLSTDARGCDAVRRPTDTKGGMSPPGGEGFRWTEDAIIKDPIRREPYEGNTRS